jgi:hypothetical protein
MEGAMGKVWVLETHTKGTGANMVPLEKERDAAAKKEPQFAVPRPRDRINDVPAPKAPPRFRVVDVMTGRVLADEASTREAIAVLGDVRSVVDVKVSVWHEAGRRWRLLTQREQKVLWDHRRAGAAAPAR